MRATSRFLSARTAMTIARNVFPVPAGPIAKVSVLAAIVATSARWPAVLGRTRGRAPSSRASAGSCARLRAVARAGERDVVGRNLRAAARAAASIAASTSSARAHGAAVAADVDAVAVEAQHDRDQRFERVEVLVAVAAEADGFGEPAEVEGRLAGDRRHLWARTRRTGREGVNAARSAAENLGQNDGLRACAGSAKAARMKPWPPRAAWSGSAGVAAGTEPTAVRSGGSGRRRRGTRRRRSRANRGAGARPAAARTGRPAPPAAACGGSLVGARLASRLPVGLDGLPIDASRPPASGPAATISVDRDDRDQEPEEVVHLRRGAAGGGGGNVDCDSPTSDPIEPRISVSALMLLKLVVVHHAEVTGAERFGDRLRDLRLGLDDLGAHGLRLGLLFLFGGLRGVLPFGGLGLRDAPVGFGLRGLQVGADVLADVDVGDVDRHDFERGPGIEAFGKHRLRDAVRDTRGLPCDRWPRRRR